MDVNFERINTLPEIARQRSSGVGIASQQDYDECRWVMRNASRNYSFASNFFPPETLRHVEALYALMRIGDDRVDVSHTGFGSALEAIDDWERLYWRAFERGDSHHPVMRAYLDTAVQCCIPAETMSAYFRAMRDDVAAPAGQVVRYPTFDDLVYYMEGSAIPVGRAMTYILGVQSPYQISDALAGADSLSIAMQLSNFWRDIGYDWQIGRVYLPQEDLQRFSVSEADLAEGRISPNFIDLLEFEFERTDLYYQAARRSIPMLASGRWAVMSGLEIYRAIISGIRRNRYDVFTLRARASQLTKMGLVLKARWSVW